MPREFTRSDRLGVQLQRELADLMRSELRDPRLSGLTIHEVEVSRDLAYATIYVSSMTHPHEEMPEIVKVLQGSAGFLRRQVGSRMKLRKVPDLRFRFDKSIENAEKMDALLNSITPPKLDPDD